MVYVPVNRKETVNLDLYTPLLFILQGAGNSEYIKNLINNWTKVRRCAWLPSFFGSICDPALSCLKSPETSKTGLGVVRDKGTGLLVPPHSLCPASSPSSLLQPHQGLGSNFLPVLLFPWHPYCSNMIFWPFSKINFSEKPSLHHSIKMVSIPPQSNTSYLPFTHNLFFSLAIFPIKHNHIDYMFCLLSLLY